jgi:hypothetical protein
MALVRIQFIGPLFYNYFPGFRGPGTVIARGLPS